MLTCHTCMRRCLRTVIEELPYLSTSSRPTPTPSVTGRVYFRRYYSSPVLKEKQKTRGREGSFGNVRRDGDTFKPNSRREWIESRGVRPAWRKKTLFDEDQEVSKQLRYLKDPLRLAEYVRKILLKDDFETAQKVVRAASKDVQCIVSWNHLVDWQLNKGSMNAAIKTFNEMKKRAQFPDAHTYTIIFRGCAMHPQPSVALAKVMMIYHSMLTEKSPVKPSVIHLNAVLKMCARAQNIDAMLAIAADMPKRGVGSPNNLSYTTIFNALRLYAVGDLRSTLTPMQKRQNIQKVLLDARRMWADIRERWTQGDIWIDEELVCAMGRLLLVGGLQDRDDILSLIEQTMNIPRQVPRLGTEARRKIDPRAHEPQVPSQDSDKGASSPEHQPGLDENDQLPARRIHDKELAVAAVDQFQPVKPPARSGAGRGGYATPGQNSLSLVLQVVLDTKLKEPAYKYWQIFTTEHNVKPDQANFHAYLRILRVARASNETVNFLLKVPMQDLRHTAFRIAMATCRRDKLNKSAFANAGKLLDLMQSALREPDIAFLEGYLELAIAAPAYSKKLDSGGRNIASKVEQGKQILRALDRLNPSFVNLKAILHFEDPDLKRKSPTERTEFVDCILSLTKKMISSYELLLNKGMVHRHFYSSLKSQQSKLAAFVTRHKHLKAQSHSKQQKPDPDADDVMKWSGDTLAVLAKSEPISHPQISYQEPSELTPHNSPLKTMKHPQKTSPESNTISGNGASLLQKILLKDTKPSSMKVAPKPPIRIRE